MELALNNGFSELSLGEMETVDGGGWTQFFKATGAILAIAASPVAVATGHPIIAGELLGAGITTIGSL